MIPKPFRLTGEEKKQVRAWLKHSALDAKGECPWTLTWFGKIPHYICRDVFGRGNECACPCRVYGYRTVRAVAEAMVEVT
uniref:Uncharacterized protein n=1 Tax=viral metagenome TaxID=1070528 RepID=A0A6M3KZX8_9ZZZZ